MMIVNEKQTNWVSEKTFGRFISILYLINVIFFHFKCTELLNVHIYIFYM